MSLQAPVDENCGGTLDTGFPGPLDVLLNLTPHTGCHALGIESALVQIEEGADLFHLGLIELAVVGEKSVMKVPEPTLGMCRQGGSGSLLGKFMAAQGEVLENEFDLLGVFLEQLLEYRREPGAVGSLKIGKNHHRHRRVGKSLGGRSVNGDLLDEIQVEHLNSFAGGVN